jgi:hypothetical protein
MSTTTVRIVLMWLFVINLGIACGAGLYEQRIVTPDWVSPMKQARAGMRRQRAVTIPD